MNLTLHQRGSRPAARAGAESGESFTLVAFHAHPDDECLLSGGTLARVSAEGHRVVLVVATAGEAGEVAPGVGSAGLGTLRMAELSIAAGLLGCARVECLGYGDSGRCGDRAGSFATADRESAARLLALLLAEEAADVLTVYDRSGGYGHPDHVAVHHVGHRAAVLAGTPLVLEATLDRRALRRVLWALAWLPRFRAQLRRDTFSPHSVLTHRVDVRTQLPAKRAALAAHHSQASRRGALVGLGPVPFLLRLPRPVFAMVAGREWFVERGRRPGAVLCDDVFDSLRAAAYRPARGRAGACRPGS